MYITGIGRRRPHQQHIGRGSFEGSPRTSRDDPAVLDSGDGGNAMYSNSTTKVAASWRPSVLKGRLIKPISKAIAGIMLCMLFELLISATEQSPHIASAQQITVECANAVINYSVDAHFPDRYPRYRRGSCITRSVYDSYVDEFGTTHLDKSGQFYHRYDFQVSSIGEYWEFEICTTLSPPALGLRRIAPLEMILYHNPGASGAIPFSETSPCSNAVRAGGAFCGVPARRTLFFTSQSTGLYSLVILNTEPYDAFRYEEEGAWPSAYSYNLTVSKPTSAEFACTVMSSVSQDGCLALQTVTDEYQYSCLPGFNHFYHAYEFSVSESSAWTFDLCGSPISEDSVLEIYQGFWNGDCPCDPAVTLVATDHNSCPGSSLNARLSELLGPGCYTLVVRSVYTADTLDYLLEVQVPLGETWNYGQSCIRTCPPESLMECASIASAQVVAADESLVGYQLGETKGKMILANYRGEQQGPRFEGIANTAVLRERDKTVHSSQPSGILADCQTYISTPANTSCTSVYSFALTPLECTAGGNFRDIVLDISLCDDEQDGTIYVSVDLASGTTQYFWIPVSPGMTSISWTSTTYGSEVLSVVVSGLSVSDPSDTVEMSCVGLAYRCLGSQCTASGLCDSASTPPPTPPPTELCGIMCGQGHTEIWGVVRLHSDDRGSAPGAELRVEVRADCGEGCTGELLAVGLTSKGGAYSICVDSSMLVPYNYKVAVVVVSTDATDTTDDPEGWTNYTTRVYNTATNPRSLQRVIEWRTLSSDCLMNIVNFEILHPATVFFHYAAELSSKQAEHARRFLNGRPLRGTVYKEDVLYPCQLQACMTRTLSWFNAEGIHMHTNMDYWGDILSHEHFHKMYFVDNAGGGSFLMNEAIAYFHQMHKENTVGSLFGPGDAFAIEETVGSDTLHLGTSQYDIGLFREGAAFIHDLEDSHGETREQLTYRNAQGVRVQCGTDDIDQLYEEIYFRATSDSLTLSEFAVQSVDSYPIGDANRENAQRIARHHGAVAPTVYPNACDGFVGGCGLPNCP